MTVKILITQVGQQLIADTKQVTRKDTEDLVAYWVTDPRVVVYSRNEDESVAVRFQPYCFVSDEREFSIKESFIVSILEPRQDVADAYLAKVAPQTDDLSTDTVTDGADPDDADGPTGVRTEGSPVEADAGIGQDEAVTATVA